MTENNPVNTWIFCGEARDYRRISQIEGLNGLNAGVFWVSLATRGGLTTEDELVANKKVGSYSRNSGAELYYKRAPRRLSSTRYLLRLARQLRRRVTSQIRSYYSFSPLERESAYLSTIHRQNTSITATHRSPCRCQVTTRPSPSRPILLMALN